MSDRLHPSHVTRASDASTYDTICINCGAHDQTPGGWGDLAKPCSKVPSVKQKDARTPELLIAGLKSLVEKMGTAIAAVRGDLEDEGDRVYLGSTNDKAVLEEADDLYHEWFILDSLPGVPICRHGNSANGSCTPVPRGAAP